MKQYVDKTMLDIVNLMKILKPTRLTKKDLNTLYYNENSQLYYAGGSNGCINMPTSGTDGFCLIVLRCAEGWCV